VAIRVAGEKVSVLSVQRFYAPSDGCEIRRDSAKVSSQFTNCSGPGSPPSGAFRILSDSPMAPTMLLGFAREAAGARLESSLGFRGGRDGFFWGGVGTGGTPSRGGTASGVGSLWCGL